MSHGYPDYGMGAPGKTIYSMLDVGELAARLGSPVTFDRRGNVIWFDNFEDTLMKWESNQATGGDYLYQTAEAARSGSFSVKMLTYINIGNHTELYCYRPLPVRSKIGFEFSYAMYSQIKYIHIKMMFGDPDGQYEYQLRYDRYNMTMAYLNSKGTYTDLPGRASHEMYYFTWATIKLVVDYENNKYVRALLNSFSWDLKDIAPKFNSGHYSPVMVLEARIVNRAAGSHYIYLDDAILTQNEP